MFSFSRSLSLAASVAAGAGLLAAAPGSIAATPTTSDTHVAVQTITRGQREPANGTRVTLSGGGARTFVNARDGFALTAVRGQLTPVRTTDGGSTWTVAGPGLMEIGAAQAPLTVLQIGASSPSTMYAYGGGQVVDISSDGGRVWRRATFQGLQVSVAPIDNQGLAAFVDEQNNRGTSGSTLQFITKNGGRSWRLVAGEDF